MFLDLLEERGDVGRLDEARARLSTEQRLDFPQSQLRALKGFGCPIAEACPLLSLSNSDLMSRKSRWRFFCIEQPSQYHLGLASDEGDRRS